MQNDTKATEDWFDLDLVKRMLDEGKPLGVHVQKRMADEIERLRAENKTCRDLAQRGAEVGEKMQREIERLRKERVNLLGRIRRIACAHKDIGLPGCTVCDPLWEQHVDVSLGASI